MYPRTCAMVCTLLMTAPLAAAVASGQTVDPEALRQEIEQLRQELAEVQRQYGERLSALEARLETAVVPAAAAPVPSSATSKVFNPDIAVVGNFLGTAGQNTVSPGPALEMAESEVSFQAIVDPYARADFFMAFGEEGVDLEEGFLTFPAIPGGLLVKVGKMRAAFGKVNTLHTHAVPWSDRPLIVNNLMGGEEGLSDAGISASRLISNPWIFLEATGQVYRGDSGDVFQSNTRGDLSYLGRLRGYRDLSDDTNVEIGRAHV